jgi:hypothetical protein
LADVIQVFISCGANRNAFRNAGVDVIRQLEQFLVSERGGPVLFNWDYRTDLPRDVPVGELAARSLEMVDQAHILVGILGDDVPDLTRREILRAYERRARGEQMRPYVFADPAMANPDRDRLLRRVRRDFGRDIIWGSYSTRTDVIHLMYLTLFRYLLERGSTAATGTGVVTA